VQLFLVAFQSLSNFVIFSVSAAVAILFVYIFVRSAMAADGRAGWVRRITSPNAKVLFGLLFIGWAVVFGIGLQVVPHEGANSPYGGLGLIALFSGFFIMMGFLWAVIGE
jgi:succinate dehydrogenase hydrophobic anchor subunit